MREEDRLSATIAAAIGGDPESGRELLSIASLQLRERGAVEPSLVDYLSSILERAYRSPPEDVASALYISESRRLPIRPKNGDRIYAMLRAVRMAEEGLVLDRGDVDHLWVEARRIERIPDDVERDAELIDWRDDYEESKRAPTKLELFELAAKLFNDTLKRAQGQGERLDEEPIKASAIRSLYYRTD